MSTASACQSVTIEGSFRFGSSLFKLAVITHSGAMKSGVPTTSGGYLPGTTKPSISMTQARPVVGSISTFIAQVRVREAGGMHAAHRTGDHQADLQLQHPVSELARIKELAAVGGRGKPFAFLLTSL